MAAIIVLFALSALIGFALGKSFAWPAVAAASAGIAVLSSVTLHMQRFDAASGIAIVFICLILCQVTYLAGGWKRYQNLFDKKTDQKPRDRSERQIAGNQAQHQKAPSWFA